MRGLYLRPRSVPSYRLKLRSGVWQPLLGHFRRDANHLAAVFMRTARSTPLFSECRNGLFDPAGYPLAGRTLGATGLRGVLRRENEREREPQALARSAAGKANRADDAGHAALDVVVARGVLDDVHAFHIAGAHDRKAN